MYIFKLPSCRFEDASCKHWVLVRHRPESSEIYFLWDIKKVQPRVSWWTLPCVYPRNTIIMKQYILFRI